MKDTLINADYTIEGFNSAGLSVLIKKYLSSKEIDFKSFNRELYEYSGQEKDMIIPVDAYEYQNFTVLKTENGEYILLDGFRRLLWNTTISHPIQVRVYRQKDLSSEQILKLLVSLNHTKFFAGLGEFYDRGFALAFKTIFDIDITKFYKSFDGYLTGESFQYSYSNRKVSGGKGHKSVCEKIVSNSFLADMKFLEDVSESDLIKSDLVFGAFVYNLRQENAELVLDSKSFINKVKQSPILLKQTSSFQKAKDSRGNDIGNKMFEMFANILLNKTEEKSFIEIETETKELIAKLKKDKNWYCYTNSKKIMPYDFWQNPTQDNKGINTFIQEYKKTKGVFPKVKVIVLPSEKPLMKYGEYDDFEIVGFTSGSHLMSHWTVLDVKRGDIKIGGGGYRDRYDLSEIRTREFGKWESNKVYLFIENIFR